MAFIPDPSKGPPPGWVNTPIILDREGRMWNDGEEIVHDRLLEFLRQHLRPNPDFGKPPEFGNGIGAGEWEIYVSPAERKPVIVKDVPYQALTCKGVPAAGPPETLWVKTYDGVEERIDPASVEIRDHVPYCRVKNGTTGARFSRQAAEQLSRYYEEKNGRVVLRMKDRDYDLGAAE